MFLIRMVYFGPVTSCKPPKETRVGVILYSIQASFAWPRVSENKIRFLRQEAVSNWRHNTSKGDVIKNDEIII